MTKPNKYLVLLGKSIKKLRLERKLTQHSFAMQLKWHRSYIGAVERGERNLSLTKVIHIAKILEIKISELLGFLDK